MLQKLRNGLLDGLTIWPSSTAWSNGYISFTAKPGDLAGEPLIKARANR